MSPECGKSGTLLEINTLAVHDDYRRHPYLVQMMSHSIQVFLVNAIPTINSGIISLEHDGMTRLDYFMLV